MDIEQVMDMYTAQLESQAGLPGGAYNADEVLSVEVDRLFRRSWLCIGAESDIPEIGDISPVHFAGAPLLLVRDKKASVRVYHNVCSHRGALLATQPRSCRRNIVCPYHNWAYNLDGQLVRTPHVGGAGKHNHTDFDITKLNLTEVRSASWNGFVFANISGDAPSFSTFIEPVQQRIGDLDQDELRFDAGLATEMTFDANWKTVVENFVESYHVPPIHPELERENPMRKHYQILGGHSYLGQGGTEYKAAETGGLKGLPLRSGSGKTTYEAFYVFPNLLFGPLPNFAFAIIINPLSPSMTHERVFFMFYGDDALTDELADQRAANAEFLMLINRQDIEICKSVQIGRSSPAFEGGVFVMPQEATSSHFLRMIAARIVAEDEKSPDQIVSLPFKNIFHEIGETE